MLGEVCLNFNFLILTDEKSASKKHDFPSPKEEETEETEESGSGEEYSMFNFENNYLIAIGLIGSTCH